MGPEERSKHFENMLIPMKLSGNMLIPMKLSGNMLIPMKLSYFVSSFYMFFLLAYKDTTLRLDMYMHWYTITEMYLLSNCVFPMVKTVQLPHGWVYV